MRRIDKGRPPDVLVRLLRETPAAERIYDRLIKGELRETCLASLRREQGGLCAYCQGRVDEPRRPATIEHYVHQSDPERGAALQLAWSNWLAVCYSEGQVQHCDKSRGNTPLLLRPSSQLEPASGAEHWSRSTLEMYDAERLISYDFVKGCMYIDPGRARFVGLGERDVAGLQHELDAVLRLNSEHPNSAPASAATGATSLASPDQHWDPCGARLARLKAAKGELARLHGGVGAGQWQPDLMRKVLAMYEQRAADGRFREYNGIVVAYLQRRLAKMRS